MFRCISRRVSFVLVIASLLTLPLAVSAGQRRHSARGTAQFVSPTGDFIGSGNATHLGAYQEVGSATFSPTSDPTVLNVEGSMTYTAANGDELHAFFSGQLNGVTGVITAEIQYDGGTGRFANATGSSTLHGQIQGDGSIQVTVSGTIDY